jgi:ubiquinol-cytochrome c reductase subunit 6
MLSSLFSSFTIHADAPEVKDEKIEEEKEGKKEEGGEEEPVPEPEPEEEEEEEEEPEDVCLSFSCLVRHGMGS